ncbi:hypothetical protein E8E13_009000 [Curvularia kusanoi]|uniref:Uncharacterized protein n=1 Tax=Curvularia kusanoi TaxID=90978 RepID=A0A9P4TF95_CURKU|nr:hypothetical protein E8E13_009000 [Curvularia kusanoi]
MSIVGIDMGTLNSVIAVARNRGVDVIANEVFDRATPSLAGFGPKSRYMESPRGDDHPRNNHVFRRQTGDKAEWPSKLLTGPFGHTGRVFQNKDQLLDHSKREHESETSGLNEEHSHLRLQEAVVRARLPGQLPEISEGGDTPQLPVFNLHRERQRRLPSLEQRRLQPSLEPDIRFLHGERKPKVPESDRLTSARMLVIPGKLAGSLKINALGDTGAKYNFMDEAYAMSQADFVIDRHQIEQITLGHGKTVTTTGVTLTSFQFPVNGQLQYALADTGAGLLIMDEDYARGRGIRIKRSTQYRTRVRFADQTTAMTSGMAHGVKWQYGSEDGEVHSLNFHVLKNAPFNVILSENFLLGPDTNAFADYASYMVDEEDDDAANCFVIDIDHSYVNPAIDTREYRDHFETVRYGEEEDWIDSLSGDEQAAARVAVELRRAQWNPALPLTGANALNVVPLQFRPAKGPPTTFWRRLKIRFRARKTSA